jgi:hypothetical protein
MNARMMRGVVCVLVTGLLCMTAGTAMGARRVLPKRVADTVNREFPKGKIIGSGTRRQNGLLFYVIKMHVGGQNLKVTITTAGQIGNIERRTMLNSLPPKVRRVVSRTCRGGKRVRIEKHERRGHVRGGRYVAIDPPDINYEVRYNIRSSRRFLRIREKDIAYLSDKARATLKRHFPKAEVGLVKLEIEQGISFHKVALREDGRHFSARVINDGTLLEVATETNMDMLADRVIKIVRENADGGKPIRVEYIKRHARIWEKRVVSLRNLQYCYEVKVAKGDRVMDIRVDTEGRFLGKSLWRESDVIDFEGDDEDEAGGADVPPAAKKL